MPLVNDEPKFLSGRLEKKKMRMRFERFLSKYAPIEKF